MEKATDWKEKNVLLARAQALLASPGLAAKWLYGFSKKRVVFVEVKRGA